MKQGVLQVYTGNGKGKTTAAFGLALRASGAGLNTVIIQFMKRGDSSEIEACKKLDKVTVHSFGAHGFVRKGAELDDSHYVAAERAMLQARKTYMDESVDLLILDELCNAVYFELVAEEEMLSLLRVRPHNLEVVVTGRNAPPALIEMADLVTEMQEIKHPYQQGMEARAGIDF
ncbi:MAG: cob(I)yrinic acid a,c-diamide adenosyltransferase [Bacillota bacterium]|nr:cob(I)yrinic acid a,c-diamide adenosyltransferase [Bacillota bacterium]